MTNIDSTRFLGSGPGGVRSPHVGECTALDMNKQRDGGRVSAAGER